MGMEVSNRVWLQRHSGGISSNHSLPNSQNTRVETLNYLQSPIRVITAQVRAFSFQLPPLSVIAHTKISRILMLFSLSKHRNRGDVVGEKSELVALGINKGTSYVSSMIRRF